MMEAYPLCWPVGVRRATRRDHSRFDRSRPFGRVRDDMLNELRLLRARDIVLSTNVPLRRDGLPYANEREPSDPGVAIYFVHPTRGQLCMACDRWRTVVENVRAISETIAALRGIARWGTAEMVDAAFTGFQALPAPGDTSDSGQPWIADPWNYLGLNPDEPDELTRSRWRDCVKFEHPDKPTGSPEGWRRAQEAWRRCCLQRPSLDPKSAPVTA